MPDPHGGSVNARAVRPASLLAQPQLVSNMGSQCSQKRTELGGRLARALTFVENQLHEMTELCFIEHRETTSGSQMITPRVNPLLPQFAAWFEPAHSGPS